MDGSNAGQSHEAIERLRSARGFVFDLFGTLTRSRTPSESVIVCPGATDLLALLNDRNIPFVVLTNGTSRHPEDYERLLTAAGLPIPASRIMTPASVAASFFVSRGMRRILVLGIESVWGPLRDAGLDVLVPSGEPIDPETVVDAVFVGWYRRFSLEDIEAACNAVRNGAGLYTGSLVPFFGGVGHRIIGSSRLICDMIENLTDVSAVPVGKPSQTALESAGRSLQKDLGTIVLVGDDPELDIRMAREGGATAFAVESGINTRNDLQDLPENHRPHATVRHLEELLQLLQ